MSSVLDQMIAGTTERKRAAATQLTPVGREAPLGVSRIPDIPEVFLTGEALTDIAKDLRRKAAVLIEVADGLDAHVGRSSAAALDTPETLAAAVKVKEAEADASFAGRFAAMQADAQAATFVAADVPVVPIVAASGSPMRGWKCPDHGDSNLKQLTSKKGRVYMFCLTCTQFEK